MSHELESRVVLSHATLRGHSVLLAGLSPRAQALNRHNAQSIITQVNTAFDSFVQDYTQARASYLSAQSQGSTTQTAFDNYTMYRVQLLGQQITTSALQSSISNSRQRGAGQTLPLLIGRKVSGVDRTTQKFNAGTLGAALQGATPSASASDAAAGLDSLAQDQAIESTRVNVINGLNILKNGDFGNKSGHK